VAYGKIYAQISEAVLLKLEKVRITKNGVPSKGVTAYDAHSGI
jgi:hypothetical protein